MFLLSKMYERPYVPCQSINQMVFNLSSPLDTRTVRPQHPLCLESHCLNLLRPPPRRRRQRACWHLLSRPPSSPRRRLPPEPRAGASALSVGAASDGQLVAPSTFAVHSSAPGPLRRASARALLRGGTVRCGVPVAVDRLLYLSRNRRFHFSSSCNGCSIGGGEGEGKLCLLLLIVQARRLFLWPRPYGPRVDCCISNDQDGSQVRVDVRLLLFLLLLLARSPAQTVDCL